MRPKFVSAAVAGIGVLAVSAAALYLASSGVQAQRAGTPDQKLSTKGFQVEITAEGGKEVDTAWESISGGGEVLARESTNSPGHKYVDTLTLRGPVTASRKSAVNAPQDEILTAGRFKVEIDGAPITSSNI
ncbi:MAG: hypothetical protein FJ319_12495 [SAR202 cluster bacterium]|nr:hypothetical protein [SAR202 cluster bacterium]